MNKNTKQQRQTEPHFSDYDGPIDAEAAIAGSGVGVRCLQPTADALFSCFRASGSVGAVGSKSFKSLLTLDEYEAKIASRAIPPSEPAVPDRLPNDPSLDGKVTPGSPSTIASCSAGPDAAEPPPTKRHKPGGGS